jgi:hypothetical protein
MNTEKKIVRKERKLIQDNDAFRDSAVTDKPIDLHWWENQINVQKGNKIAS